MSSGILMLLFSNPFDASYNSIPSSDTTASVQPLSVKEIKGLWKDFVNLNSRGDQDFSPLVRIEIRPELGVGQHWAGVEVETGYGK